MGPVLLGQDGSPVCERCLLAETPLTRLKGLLGRRGLEQGEGSLLRPVAFSPGRHLTSQALI